MHNCTYAAISKTIAKKVNRFTFFDYSYKFVSASRRKRRSIGIYMQIAYKKLVCASIIQTLVLWMNHECIRNYYGSVNVVWCYKQPECKPNCELFGCCLNFSILFLFSCGFFYDLFSSLPPVLPWCTAVRINGIIMPSDRRGMCHGARVLMGPHAPCWLS